MAKHQNLSAYQQGIVKRYYEHRDTLSLQKLAELVSELYLCTDEKKAAKMWERAAQSLEKVEPDPAKVRKIIERRDVKELARIVGEMSGGKPRK